MEVQERKFTGVFIPAEIYENDEYDVYQKVILGFLYTANTKMTIKEISMALKINKQRIAKECIKLVRMEAPIVKTKICTEDFRIQIAYCYKNY